MIGNIDYFTTPLLQLSVHSKLLFQFVAPAALSMLHPVLNMTLGSISGLKGDYPGSVIVLGTSGKS